MHSLRQTEVLEQGRMVQALLENMRIQTGSNVRLLETHISWVLLAGHYAYKIKKAVDLGFLDFSTLQARRNFCEEEIRLNRRLAPRLYLNVIAIGGSVAAPVLDAEPAIEYAVRMRRFAASKQLDVLLAHHKLLPAHIDSLAATIANFHLSLPAAGIDTPFGTATSVQVDAEQNFTQLQELLEEQADLDVLAALHRANDMEYAACCNLFEQRRMQGFVRECHGDMHLGNIVLINEQPVPFDCIEFNSALRWIDVISEVAFTVMDLLQHGRTELAYRFLNAYLEVTGDYAGIQILRFYIAYRAMVRAKVSAIRASQPGLSNNVQAAAWASCRDYHELASNCFASRHAALIITHGLPGSGKTTFAQIALEFLPAIRLRSDVERKRMFGLNSLADSHAGANINLYAADVTQQTYARLLELAAGMLKAGYTVIVDAAFLNQAERVRFRRLADELSLPFAIVSIHANTEALRSRIKLRKQAANDASEADIAVLEKLIRIQQPLSSTERSVAVDFVNDSAGFATEATGWSRLLQLLSK